MSDDPRKTGRQDRAQVNVHEAYEVAYIVKKLGVTSEQVREAARQVGKSRRKVEEYLLQHK